MNHLRHLDREGNAYQTILVLHELVTKEVLVREDFFEDYPADLNTPADYKHEFYPEYDDTEQARKIDDIMINIVGEMMWYAFKSASHKDHLEMKGFCYDV